MNEDDIMRIVDEGEGGDTCASFPLTPGAAIAIRDDGSTRLVIETL
jgi:hypothetical protein